VDVRNGIVFVPRDLRSALCASREHQRCSDAGRRVPIVVTDGAIEHVVCKCRCHGLPTINLDERPGSLLPGPDRKPHPESEGGEFA
jgi:hypothetical protein